MDAMANLADIRKGFLTLGNIYPAHPSVTVEPAIIAGIQCYWFIPTSAPDDRLIIHLHGGAFGMGSIESHAAMITHFAAALQTRFLFIEYSLAPEHIYPTAIEEIVAVYSELIKTHSADSISFIGDSAGGGLIVSAISVLQQRDIPQPHSVTLLSPWLDLTCTNPSYEERREQDRILNRETLLVFAANYAGIVPASGQNKNANTTINSNVGPSPATDQLTNADSAIHSNADLTHNADSSSNTAISASNINQSSRDSSPRSLSDVSPKNAPLKTFPPVLILVGTNEVLFDDSRLFYEAIYSLQPNERLSIYDGQYHVWPLSDIHSEASRNALNEIASHMQIKM